MSTGLAILCLIGWIPIIIGCIGFLVLILQGLFNRQTETNNEDIDKYL